MKKDVTKIADNKTKLKEKATKLVRHSYRFLRYLNHVLTLQTKQEVDIDDDETIGNGSFTWEVSPAVCGVIVYRDSQVGSVTVTGADESDEIVTTGPGKTGVIMIVVKAGQTCMLSGHPTVIYIRPATR